MIKQGYLALLFFMVRQHTCQFPHILLTQRNGDRDLYDGKTIDDFF